jgi:hypothetical protein
MADSFIYDDTLESNMVQEPFIEKKIMSISDTANGNYSGFIEFDTNMGGLASCGRYVDYSNSYIEIPFVVSMTYTTDTGDNARVAAAAAAFSPYMVGIKAGFHQLIHSCSIQYNGITISDHQPLTNAYISFKNMTSMSKNDVKKWAPTTGFYPDTASSFGFFNWDTINNGYDNAAVNSTIVNGDGYTNNLIYPNKAAGVPNDFAFAPFVAANAGAHTGSVSPIYPVLDLYNEGFYNRLKLTSYPIGSNAAQLGIGIGSLPELKTTGQTNFIAKSYCVDNGSADDKDGNYTRRLQWNMVAIIKLKEISSFFENMPLIKGSQIRINIIYNSCRVNITGTTTVRADDAGVGENGNTPRIFLQLADGGYNQISGNSCPIMAASCGYNTIAGAGLSPPLPSILACSEAALEHKLEFFYECGIARTSTSFAPPQIATCRLYAPVYFMKKEYEEQLLSISPSKTIEYIDFYSYQINSIATGGYVDYVLTSGIAEPEYIVILPYANTNVAQSVFSNTNNAGLNQWQSPFDSAPNTTLPMGQLSNIQIQVSGKNILDDKFYYDFQTYINEVQSLGSINGGMTTGINNGLVGYHEWSNGYRYYLYNLSRRLPNNVAPKSIKLLCQNVSGVSINLLVFIAYKKRINVNLTNGSIV